MQRVEADFELCAASPRTTWRTAATEAATATPLRYTHTHTHRDQQRSTKCVQQLKKVNGGVFLNFEKKTVKSLSKNVGLRAVLETKSTEPSVTVQINTHAVVCKWLKELRTELPNSTFAVQVTQSSCDLISKD